MAARRGFGIDRPAVVVGFGGYPTIPAMAAAVSLGIPRMIHEQNGVMGRVNKIFAPRADRVACGTWPTAQPPGVKGIHTGNPVRQAVLDMAGAPYQPPGDDQPLNLLVIGGSQGARVLSKSTVPEAIAGLPDDIRARLRISHQARAEDAARVTAAYAQAGITAEVQPFFDDVPRRLAECQLVVSRRAAPLVGGRYHRDRPAGDPDPLCRRDRRSPDRQCPCPCGSRRGGRFARIRA